MKRYGFKAVAGGDDDGGKIFTVNGKKVWRSPTLEREWRFYLQANKQTIWMGFWLVYENGG